MVHKMKEWRTVNNLTLEKAAEVLGLESSYVSLLERGLRIPKLRKAIEIEDKTYGFVKPRDWINNN